MSDYGGLGSFFGRKATRESHAAYEAWGDGVNNRLRAPLLYLETVRPSQPLLLDALKQMRGPPPFNTGIVSYQNDWPSANEEESTLSLVCRRSDAITDIPSASRAAPCLTTQLPDVTASRAQPEDLLAMGLVRKTKWFIYTPNHHSVTRKIHPPIHPHLHP